MWTWYSCNGSLRLFKTIFNYYIQLAIRITEVIVKCARFMIGNIEDTRNLVGYVGVFEPFLDHHMILLDKSRADKSLYIIPQLCLRAYRYFV